MPSVQIRAKQVAAGAGTLEHAVEVLVRGFSFTRSYTHPYLAERIGSCWIMRDGPRTSGTMKIVSAIAILVIANVLSSCDKPHDSAGGRIQVAAVNSTSENVYDVSVEGSGYPGPFGVIVPSGRKLISYPASTLGDSFNVLWKSGAGDQQRTLSRPPSFDLTGGSRLIVEFTPGGDVKAHTEPMPR